MTTLLENPLPILAIGAVLATVFGIVFLSRRTLPSLVGLGAVILFTTLLLITEQLIVTPREEIEQAISQLLEAVQSNEVSNVLALIDPAADNVRSDAEKLMPMVNVEDAGASSLEIEVNAKASPQTATSRCRGRLRGIHRESGQQLMYFDQVEFQWVRRDDRWLLEGFTAFWKGKPLNAVNSLQGKQPSPATR